MLVYRLLNTKNGKSYVGQTIQDLSKRLYRHKSIKTNTTISKAIAKYGFDTFEVSILQKCSDQDELNKAEEFWVTFYDCLSPKGYNLKEGGGSKGKFSDEVKRKLSESHKGQFISAERRKKVSETFKGRVFTAEHLAKIAASRKLWSASKAQEVKDKMSIAKKGKVHSQESRNKMAIKKLGTRHNAKLSWEIVRQIRLVGSLEQATELALEYGVHPASIRNILRFNTWKIEA